MQLSISFCAANEKQVMLNTHATNRSSEAAQGAQHVCAVSDILSAAKRSQRAYGLLALHQAQAVVADSHISPFNL
jgi:hypothetical protein